MCCLLLLRQARRAEEAKRDLEDKEKADRENALKRVAGEREEHMLMMQLVLVDAM